LPAKVAVDHNLMLQLDRGSPRGLGGGEKHKLRLAASLPPAHPRQNLLLSVESCEGKKSQDSDNGISWRCINPRDNISL